MKLLKRFLTSPLIFILLFVNTSWATPTGLNNIPTADVVPEKVLVLQGITELGKINKPGYFAGFKYGLIENLEVGLDGRIFPEAALEWTYSFQFKYRVALGEKSALALGIANLGDRARTGWEDYYLALTHDFDFARAHLGGRLQRDNEGVFAGFDKTIPLFERNLTLRGDFTQTNDQEDATFSSGFIYDLGYNFLLESWLSFPTERGKKNVGTIKINYVIKF